jgi:hypothetical protein
VTFADAPLTASAAPAFSAIEGTASDSQVVATFTDANPGDHTGDFTATISWGDNSTSAGTVSYDSGSGVYSVSGSHTYAEDGSYNITVSITDEGGAVANTLVGVTGTGAVVLSPTQAAGAWYPDRYPPAGFTAGPTVGSIDEFISASDQDGSRPSGFNSGFYDYQGRKYDLPSGATSLGVDLFVPSSWSGLNQQDPSGNPANSGSLASVWGTGLDSSGNVASFPIIGFNNQAGGFQVFDQTNGWTNAGGFTGYDKSYTLSFAIDGDTIDYYVNGSLVYTDTTDTGTVSLSNVILQGYDGGNSYHISWANLAAVTTTTALVDDAPLQASGVAPLTAKEGAGTNLVLATFTDANPKASLSDYTATIDWGDGSTPTVVTAGSGGITKNSDGSFSVNGTHAFLTPTGTGTDTITVDISDNGGADTGITDYVSVTNVSPAASISGPASGTPGQTLSYTGNFTDPGQGGDETYTFSWTVKNSGGTVIATGSNQTFSFTLPKPVQGSGIYTITFKVADGFGGSSTAVKTVKDPAAPVQAVTAGGVANPAPASPAAPVLSAVTVGSSRNANLVLTVSDPLAVSDFALIFWGDGAFQVVRLGSGGSSSVKHRYSRHARHVTITVLAFDPQSQAFSNMVTIPYTIQRA